MKFKEREPRNELYDEMRYNKNTIGVHESIHPANPNQDKKYCGALSIFSLMTMCHYYEKASNDEEVKMPKNILHRMFINAEKAVNPNYIENEEIGVLR